MFLAGLSEGGDLRPADLFGLVSRKRSVDPAESLEAILLYRRTGQKIKVERED